MFGADYNRVLVSVCL